MIGSVPPQGVSPLLFADRGCPFAHRVLALLHHLGVSVERRESAVGYKPEGLVRYFPSERVPLLLHRDLALTESRVIIEYLADRYEFAHAYPKDLVARTRHRHAMAMVDSDLTTVLFGPPELDVVNLRITDMLGVLEVAAATVDPRPCLLALHLAPIWRCFRALKPTGVVTGAIQDRPALHQWLEAAADLDCVVQTAYDPAILKQDLARARESGLIDSNIL